MSSNEFSSFMADIDHWTAKWEDAQKKGIFKDAPKPAVSQATADNSFFGPSDTKPGDMSDEDAQYWASVNKLVDEHPHGLVTEQSDKKGADGKTPAEVAKAVAASPNPIQPSTVGNDQTDPHSMGVTYTDEQLEELADLKVRLHELEDKLVTASAKGLNFQKLESQIKQVRQQIDDLSDDLAKPTQPTTN